MTTWQQHSRPGEPGLWLRQLSYGYFLAVAEDEPGKWSWEHRGGHEVSPGGDRPLIARSERRASSAAAARRRADRYLAGSMGGNPVQKFTLAPRGMNGST